MWRDWWQCACCMKGTNPNRKYWIYFPLEWGVFFYFDLHCFRSAYSKERLQFFTYHSAICVRNHSPLDDSTQHLSTYIIARTYTSAPTLSDGFCFGFEHCIFVWFLQVILTCPSTLTIYPRPLPCSPTEKHLFWMEPFTQTTTVCISGKLLSRDFSL